MDPAHLEFIRSVLCHAGEVKIDWDAVATENGITRKDNATTKFKNIMKKHGLDYTQSKFFRDPAYTPETPSTTSKAPRTPKTPKAISSKGSQKRKAEEKPSSDDDHDRSTPVNGSKKQKTKNNVKSEELDGDSVGNGKLRSLKKSSSDDENS